MLLDTVYFLARLPQPPLKVLCQLLKTISRLFKQPKTRSILVYLIQLQQYMLPRQ